MDNMAVTLDAICLASKIILESGGETYRAEETVERMCAGLHISRVDVLALPTGLMLTLDTEDHKSITRIVRVHNRPPIWRGLIYATAFPGRWLKESFRPRRPCAGWRKSGSRGKIIPGFLLAPVPFPQAALPSCWADSGWILSYPFSAARRCRWRCRYWKSGMCRDFFPA